MQRTVERRSLSGNRNGAPAAILAAFLIIAASACSSSAKPGAGNRPAAPEKLTASSRTYAPDDLKEAGAKVVKTYDVSGLPGATAAVNAFLNRREYEARFYPSFVEASSTGAVAAFLVTGEKAVVTGNTVPWEEGATDRRACVGGVNANCIAKYGDFIVYGNVVLMCEGRDSATSLETCFELVKRLPK